VLGLGDLELLEEDLRHLVVVVLAGMDEDVLEMLWPALEHGGYRRDLHEVRAGPDDGEDLQPLRHRREGSLPRGEASSSARRRTHRGRGPGAFTRLGPRARFERRFGHF
jgi:hypothetical protein